MLDYVWTGLILASLVFAALGGNMEALSAAVTEGAGRAVSFCLELCGGICLWSGLLKVMERAGLSALLGRALRPLLKLLYPKAAREEAVLSALAENFSANLLGLGNAATPAGIRAARARARGVTATDELCRLMVVNSASGQLIPATVCTLRAAAGSRRPYDILPAVWLSSLCALAAGLLCAALLRRVWRKGP